MTGRKGMDSAAARHSGNVYNRPSYGAVGNAVCRLWESSFYFSTGCEWRFPWRNGWLCTFPLCYLFCFSAEPMLCPFNRPTAYEVFQGNAQPAPARSCSGGLGVSPNKRFCGAKRQSVYHSALLANFVAILVLFEWKNYNKAI